MYANPVLWRIDTPCRCKQYGIFVDLILTGFSQDIGFLRGLDFYPGF